ncbi:MAG: outer membrane lipoprotein-sorting protein [SAR324 cluster bacterium]|nr:outer membrane lipoprotein-sorting protein [SAR324 cluster bacterium]
MKQKLLLGSIACILLLGTSLSPLLAETPEEKGRAIMEAVDKLPAFEKTLSENVFKIYDSQEKLIFTKKARSANFHENYKDPQKRLSRAISYFYFPADDQGNSALMIEQEGADDDQWIYLKGLRKPKRVIGSDKSSSFMGSDFSNGDMAARDINDYNYTWLGTDTVNFKGKSLQVDKIQSEFKNQQNKDDYGYSKTIIWMDPRSGLVFKGEIYNLQGQLYKQMQLLSFLVKKNRDDQKIFVPGGFEMKNVIKGTKTVMEIDRFDVEQEADKVDPSIFNLQYLTRKWW